MQNSWNRANVHGAPFGSWIFIQSLYHPDLSLRFSNWTFFFSPLVRPLGLERKEKYSWLLEVQLGEGWVDTITTTFIIVHDTATRISYPDTCAKLAVKLCRYNDKYLSRIQSKHILPFALAFSR